MTESEYQTELEDLRSKIATLRAALRMRGVMSLGQVAADVLARSGVQETESVKTMGDTVQAMLESLGVAVAVESDVETQAPARPEPDFAGFARQLRDEADWSARIHAGDKTGQAASDQAALRRLAVAAERVGRLLGFLPALRERHDYVHPGEFRVQTCPCAICGESESHSIHDSTAGDTP